jgi:hypothetical protein
MPVRDPKRRGAGWIARQADIGWSNSLGWCEGFCLLVTVIPNPLEGSCIPGRTIQRSGLATLPADIENIAYLPLRSWQDE